MDFKELTMKLQHEGQRYQFQGLIVGSPQIISSHRMENLLKKGHSGIISQLHSIQVVETPSVHPDSKLSSPNIKLFFPLLRDFLLLVVFMIIPFPLFLAVFLPMFTLIVTHFPKRMKLRK
jgi:type IV secretory pathway VirB6-like protein